MNTRAGANYIEDAKGRLVDLRRMDATRRKAFAARLLTPVRLCACLYVVTGDWLTDFCSHFIPNNSRARRCGGICTTATWCS
jgi:hypothetical protein